MGKVAIGHDALDVERQSPSVAQGHSLDCTGGSQPLGPKTQHAWTHSADAALASATERNAMWTAWRIACDRQVTCSGAAGRGRKADVERAKSTYSEPSAAIVRNTVVASGGNAGNRKRCGARVGLSHALCGAGATYVLQGKRQGCWQARNQWRIQETSCDGLGHIHR